MEVEVRGALRGLHLAWAIGAKKIILETDILAAVKLICCGKQCNSNLARSQSNQGRDGTGVAYTAVDALAAWEMCIIPELMYLSRPLKVCGNFKR